MSLELSWVGEERYGEVGLVRARAYAASAGAVAEFRAGVTADGRAGAGDFLLATRGGEPVGTATSLSLTLWCRGAAVPCQGVAFVGTSKTARRRGAGESRGVAGTVMGEVLRRARERGQPLSALMPFRASYYEHFGYGTAERRAEWTVPTGVLPAGDFAGVRFADLDDAADLAATSAVRRRACEAGQLDAETSPAEWATRRGEQAGGMTFLDQPQPDGPARSYCFVAERGGRGNSTLVVEHLACAGPADLRRLLHFLASLRDQHNAVVLTLPVDVPLARLLAEPQLPHRPVGHAHAACRTINRMQVRVLDHRRFLEALHLPPAATGRVGVSVRETEGGVSRFTVDLADGRATVTDGGPPGSSSSPAGVPTIDCADVAWAPIAAGDLPATTALRYGLIAGDSSGAAVLDALSVGPAPFCNVYF